MVLGVEVMLFQLSDVLGPGPRSQAAPVSAQVRVWEYAGTVLLIGYTFYDQIYS